MQSRRANMLKLTKRFLLPVIALLALVLSASALPTATAATKSANPYGASAVDPAGPNEVILTVKAGGKTTSYKMADLIALKPIAITINEPFVKKRQQFTVIPFSVILAKSGIKPNTKLDTVALNDYVYSNTAANFASAKAFLAIARAGVPIPYDQGGPIRLVYPDNSKWTKFLDPWNWSLSSIVAK